MLQEISSFRTSEQERLRALDQRLKKGFANLRARENAHSRVQEEFRCQQQDFQRKLNAVAQRLETLFLFVFSKRKMYWKCVLCVCVCVCVCVNGWWVCEYVCE